MTTAQLIQLIDAELSTLTPSLDKVDTYQELNTTFARIRKLKYARQIISELSPPIKKIGH